MGAIEADKDGASNTTKTAAAAAEKEYDDAVQMFEKAEDVKAKAEEVKAAEKKAADIKKANELEDVSKKLKAKAEPLVKAAEENGATEEAKKASDEAVMEWHTAQDKLKDFMDGS